MLSQVVMNKFFRQVETGSMAETQTLTGNANIVGWQKRWDFEAARGSENDYSLPGWPSKSNKFEIELLSRARICWDLKQLDFCFVFADYFELQKIIDI